LNRLNKIILIFFFLQGQGLEVIDHLNAQETTQTYSFIEEEFNHLFFPSDSSSFMTLFSKLKKLESGGTRKLSIVHMGGSHVQGGAWSNAFVNNLQAAFNVVGAGYFGFPYKIAKTNGQPYLNSFSSGSWKRCRAVGKEFCLPLGMSALSANTNDSANFFGVALTKKSGCKQFTTVKVYHNFNGSFDFVLLLNDSTRLHGEEFRGQGYTQFRLAAPKDSVVFLLTRCDTLQKDFVLFGLSVEDDINPGFYLAGLGANGASSNSFLRCEFLLPQLASLNADLFILSLGVNDTQSKTFEKADFVSNYDSLITFIRKSNPHAAILLTTTTDNYIKRRTSNKRTVVARDAMYELVEKHKVAVWDVFSIMGGYRSMPKWQMAGLASPDKVHFTNKGYLLLGDLMFRALYKSYRCNTEKK